MPGKADRMRLLDLIAVGLVGLVLIGGGVALAALQISLLAGAQTIVTSSSADKLRRAATLGAHHTLNYNKSDDLAREVLKLTADRGVDVAFDTVGAATLPVNIQALRKGGRMVLCGVTGGSESFSSSASFKGIPTV